MMNVLLINQTFYPDVASTAQHLTDLAEGLVEQGHSVTVLAGRASYTTPHRLHPRREEYRGVKIIRAGRPLFGGGTRFRRIADALLMNAAFALTLLRLGKFDVVVALTSPPLVAFIGVLFAKWKKSKFVYWLMDVNPDQAIEAGWLSRESLKAKILVNALSFVLRNSDTIVALDEFMKLRVCAKGAPEERVTVLAPWPVQELFNPVEHSNNPFRSEHGLNGKFVVMYSGNHSICHPLTTVLEASLRMRNDDSVLFLYVGGGVRTHEVKEFKLKHGLSNILQLGYQHRDQLCYSLSAADLHLVVMGSQYVGIVHPCKIYGILNTERPFVYIGPMESHIGEIIKECGVGEQIDHNDVGALIEAIERAKLAAGEKQGLNTSDKVRELQSRFSKERLLGEMIRAL